jgi:hypothetical protein
MVYRQSKYCSSVAAEAYLPEALNRHAEMERPLVGEHHT